MASALRIPENAGRRITDDISDRGLMGWFRDRTFDALAEGRDVAPYARMMFSFAAIVLDSQPVIVTGLHRADRVIGAIVPTLKNCPFCDGYETFGHHCPGKVTR
jgi:hypothetical protein